MVARALDSWWEEFGRPSPFTVVEAGAGPGSLAKAVVAAAPRCGHALRYVLVERSSALRARNPGGFESLAQLPRETIEGVVLANELLDNIPFRLLERRPHGGWAEVHVDRSQEFLEPVDEEAAAEADRLAPDAHEGARIALQQGAQQWLRSALSLVSRGRVLVVDYADTTPSMARRPWTDWVRTYRGHSRAGLPLDHPPGEADITCEVAVDQLAAVAVPTNDRSQADFLRTHGIDELADLARAEWHERAHIGDLQALAARSRVSEAAALTDRGGLGAFRVLEWEVTP